MATNPMPIKYEEYNHVCVATPEADFIGAEAIELRKHIEQVIETKQIVDFVIDFEKAGFTKNILQFDKAK